MYGLFINSIFIEGLRWAILVTISMKKIKQYNAIGKDWKEILIQIGTASLRT